MSGAGVTVWRGVLCVLDPEPLERAVVVYAVLAASAVFEGVSRVVSLRAFQEVCQSTGIWQATRESKDPPKFMVLLEDTAALVGLAIAALGGWLSITLGDPRYDGAASILIGLVLASVAIVLVRETKGLLIGERADPELTAGVLDEA